jgi:hypothetical protein
MMNQYTHEKIMQIERGLMERRALMAVPAERKPVFGSVVSMAGRALQRIGDGLETWGTAEQAPIRR